MVMHNVRVSSQLIKILVIAALLACAGILIWSTSRKSDTPPVVYLDESSGEFWQSRLHYIPPMENSNEGTPTIVRAVMAREPLTISNTLYLFRFTAEARQSLDATAHKSGYADPSIEALFRDNHGKEVRRPEARAKWVPADSPEGRRS